MKTITFHSIAVSWISILNRYVPDTAARPILGKKKRAKLKKKAAIASGFVLSLALILRFTLNDQIFYSLVALGAMYAVVSVLPVTYMLLGRSMNNFEKFEREAII